MTLGVERAPCAPGEAEFRLDRLLVAVWFGRPRRIEQVVDGRPWRGLVRPGEMHVIVPGEERLFRKKEAGEYVCVTIPTGLAEELGEPLARLRPHELLRDEPLGHIVRALIADADAGAPDRLFREAGARAILARLAGLDRGTPALARGGLPAALLLRIVDLLHAHIAEDLSVDDLAEAAGMSAAHFATLFRNSVGEPPHRYRLRLRVERARELIERGSDLTHAALATGFCDQSHLTRQMRRVLGTTPGALARARLPAARRSVVQG